jgi:hypothetical protein
MIGNEPIGARWADQTIPTVDSHSHRSDIDDGNATLPIPYWATRSLRLWFFE